MWGGIQVYDTIFLSLSCGKGGAEGCVTPIYISCGEGRRFCFQIIINLRPDRWITVNICTSGYLHPAPLSKRERKDHNIKHPVNLQINRFIKKSCEQLCMSQDSIHSRVARKLGATQISPPAKIPHGSAAEKVPQIQQSCH